MKPYLCSSQEVFQEFSSSAQGLTAKEAQKRLAQNGPNKLDQAPKKSVFSRFLDQLKDPMILVLLAAAVISAVTSFMEGKLEADVFIILFVVIVNAILGVYQESKAEKAIEALQEMACATSKVMRGGELVQLKSEELVPGDVIELEAGDSVPADARLFETASLKVEEAALTGESVPVNKKTQALAGDKTGEVPLGDRKNMVYMGSAIAYGRGKAVVAATGMKTEMGKIAHAITQAEDGQTPLQKKLSQLSKVLSFIVLGICVGIFVLNLVEDGLHGIPLNLDTVLSSFLIAVSLAVAAIPEGLAAVVTIVLSIGVTKMSKRNAVIRKLTAVETLGCAQIICSDKTGTLTQNKMTVVEHAGPEALLAKAMALCCDAKVSASDGSVMGEPTEAALVNYALSLNQNKNDLEAREPRVGEAPFDSLRKMMSTVHRQGNAYIQYTKGAPDEVLKKCTHIYENGTARPMTPGDRERILAKNTGMANQALRCLAAAFREYPVRPSSFEASELERELTFIGLTGMIDPVRPEVKAAIQKCNDAGIRPVMITGDHKDTAVAIAMELGIIQNAEQAITGAELAQMDDREFDRRVEDFSVYARVQPEHKVRIVNAWKKRGKVTAMTGDGVNDAPSIKSADIGIGMGITGTDVTKNVADMVLADDNFATIVSAVEEGRRIYDNIRKAIQFLLSSNLSEVMCILVATLGLGSFTGGPFTILLPVHLLWINLVTDCFPAISLGMEQAERNIMKRKPRKSSAGIFSGGLGADTVYQGLTVTVLTLIAYVLGYNKAVDNEGLHNIAITMAFLTMSMCEIFHAFNMRSQRQSLFSMGTPNWYLVVSMLASLVLTTAVVYVPFLRSAFHLAFLEWYEFLEAMALSFAIVPVVEIVKFFQRLSARRKQA